MISSPLTEQQNNALQNGLCPFCSSPNFLHGPCGGCSENIRCCGCGKEFNFSAPFPAELLNRNCPEAYSRQPFNLALDLRDADYTPPLSRSNMRWNVVRSPSFMVLAFILAFSAGYLLYPALLMLLRIK